MTAKILIVDDRSENLLALEKVLDTSAAEVFQATSGNDALKLLMKHQFALAILDVQMPEMDGFELAVLIRQEIKSASLPIIFVSAVYSDDWHIFKGYEAGAVDFLSKPFDPAQLNAKVNVFLQLHQQREYYREKLDYLGMSIKQEKDNNQRHLLSIQRHKNASVLTARLAELIQYSGSTLEMMQHCLKLVIESSNTDSGALVDYDPSTSTFVNVVSLGQCTTQEQVSISAPTGAYFSYVNANTKPDPLQQCFVNLLGNRYALIFYDPAENIGLVLGNQRENRTDKLAFTEQDRVILESALNVIIMLIQQRRTRGSSLVTNQLFERLTSDYQTNIDEIVATQKSFEVGCHAFYQRSKSYEKQASFVFSDGAEATPLEIDMPTPFVSETTDSKVVTYQRNFEFEAEKTGVIQTLNKALSLEEARGKAIERLEYTNHLLDATRAIAQLITLERSTTELLRKACNVLVSSGVFINARIRMIDDDNKNNSDDNSNNGSDIINDLNSDIPRDFFAGQVDDTDKYGIDFSDIDQALQVDHRLPLVRELRGSDNESRLNTSIKISATVMHQSSVYGMLFGTLSPRVKLDGKVQTLLTEIAQELGFAIYTLKREKIHKNQDLELKLILEAADIGTWTYHLPKDDGYRSPHIAKFLGHDEAHTHFTFKSWKSDVHPEDFAAVATQVQRHLNDEAEYYEVEYRVQRSDGQWSWVHDRGRVIERNSQGEAVVVCGTQSNISARKQAEYEQNVLQAQLTQSQKLESIGRLAGGVAHDFNNLLSVIMGFSDLLLMDHDHNQATKKKLETIKQACDKAKNLTTQLLMFSRKQTIQPKVVEWNKLILESLNVYSRLIEESIEVKFEINEALPCMLADPQQLDQILANLLVNARDAVQLITDPDHKPKINISTHTVHFKQARAGVREQAEYVCLKVSDNGIGMTDEVKTKVFEPFYSTKGLSKGTGLGLSTVFGIVEQNKGFIEVDSEPDLGTVFTIYWPVSEHKIEGAQRQVNNSISVSGNGQRILVVEDELQIRQYCKEVLIRNNYEVTLAASAEEAMALVINGERPDLLMTDIVLPEKSGHQLALEIQELMPELPILYCSGYTDDIISKHGVVDPDITLINKPFVSEQLLSTIQLLLTTQTTKKASERLTE